MSQGDLNKSPWESYLEGGGLQSEEIIKSALLCKVHYVLNSDINSYKTVWESLLGCAIFTFFYSIQSESKYMDLICFIFICYGRKHHLFASFNWYSLHDIHTNLHTNIRFDAKQIHVEANIRFRANICFTFSHSGKYLLQNIRFKVNICKYWMFKVIFACKYSHTKEYSLRGMHFTSLRPQLLFGSFWKYSLYFASKTIRASELSIQGCASRPTTLYLHRLMTRSACLPGLPGSRL